MATTKHFKINFYTSPFPPWPVFLTVLSVHRSMQKHIPTCQWQQPQIWRGKYLLCFAYADALKRKKKQFTYFHFISPFLPPCNVVWRWTDETSALPFVIPVGSCGKKKKKNFCLVSGILQLCGCDKDSYAFPRQFYHIFDLVETGVEIKGEQEQEEYTPLTAVWGSSKSE